MVFLLACVGFLLSCQPPNHHLIHPKDVPPQVQTWVEETEGDRYSSTWSGPGLQAGPFPAVLVHPDGGSTALKMRGVVWDLACHGYLAVAADYRRLLQGKYRRTLFPWREEAESTVALELLQAHPLVDPNRLAALGFSQGGIFSLLIAARAPEIKAVVAYYPVTDFVQWFAYSRPNPLQRLAFRVIRWHFRRQSGAHNERNFRLSYSKPRRSIQAEHILAPVLLLHGDRDGAAPVEESRRLAERLVALRRQVNYW